jgi:hypothetical protein
MEGMQDISQILRCNSALVEEHLSEIYNILSKLIFIRKTTVEKRACQLAQEIFQTVQCMDKPVSKCQLRNPSTYMKKLLKA